MGATCSGSGTPNPVANFFIKTSSAIYEVTLWKSWQMGLVADFSL